MSTNAKEYKLAIRIAGAVDKTFSTSLASANAALKANETTIQTLNKSFTKLDKGFDSIMNVGQKCFSAIATAAGVAATAVGAVVAESLSVGSEFESAFAGVRKTVDATEEEFSALREDIIGMTREIPSSASDIASTMEIAGQLGIATDSLLDFTETMINLGVATNLTSDEAADALARFANITNMENYGADGVSNYERLGSVIVDLGNNFATTESEIVAMATNIAATGEMVGLTEPQIMALATAMSATGIEAEKGGSALSKLIRKMQLSVETGSESLNNYASVAGMTADEFSAAFEDDAVGALSAFIEGLNDEERNGKSAIAVLDDMGLTEARMTDVLLRLANAQGDMTQEEIDAAVEAGVYSDATLDASYSASLMGEALERANTAWDENVALANEAGERYKTFESRVTIMKSAFDELGIAIYDNLTRTPAMDIIDGITEAVQDFTDTGLDDWIDGINAALPTLQRKAKNAWKTVSPFVDGVLDFGEWALDNGEYLVSFVGGLAAALGSYKVASDGTKLLSFLSGLSGTQWGIIGVTAAIGGLVDLIMIGEAYVDDLADASLESHFGSISLSLEDIQKAAEHIVETDSLGAVQDALENFDDLDGFTETMEDALDTLNKMNWKVEIGMELDTDEQDDYVQAINDYVQAAQDYALQERYAVSVNLSIGLGDDDTSGITDKVNKFYENTYDEMVSLGDDLSDTVNEAFSDNILDPDEIVAISDIQKKIAELQKTMATSEFDAQMALLDTKYGGESLTAESFENLQSGIADALETEIEAFDEAYTKNYAAIKNAASGENATLTDEEAITALDELQNNYLAEIAEATAKAANFQIDTISDLYMGEVRTTATAVIDGDYDWLSEVAGMTEDQLALMDYDPLEEYWGEVYQNLGSTDTMLEVRSAVGELVEEMQPTVEELENTRDRYLALGKDVPESILEGLENAQLLQDVANGSVEAYLELIGQQLSGTEYGDLLQEIYDTGREVPESLVEGLSEGLPEGSQEAVDTAVTDSYTYTQDQIDETFGQDFEVESTLDVSIIPKISYGDILESETSGVIGGSEITLPGFFADSNADGGIIQNKELSWVAENGPESIIPLDGSQNAIDLWEKTGQLLGMESVLDKYQLQDAGQSYEVSYQPTLNFYGGTPTKEDLTDALSISQEEFDQRMEQFMKTHRRVSFG